MATHCTAEPRPMPHTQAGHLLNPLRRLILSPKQLVARLGLQPQFTVLELGPGPGYFSVEVARALPRGRLILVDVQQEMLDMARERLERHGLTNVEYVCADARRLPLADAGVDVAFLVAVLGEVPEPDKAMCELHRVLRPGGKLSLTERMIGDPHSLDRDYVATIALQAGFSRPERMGRLTETVNFAV